MADLNAVNRTLLAILDNQERRTAFAFEALPDAVYNADPGGGCNSIRKIGEHLIRLRQFQLMLLGSPLAERVPSVDAGETVELLLEALATGTDLVRQAIARHDPMDWYEVPATPREGRWGEDPTIERFVRPFNDFTNHLGAVRAIRRMLGAGADRVQ